MHLVDANILIDAKNRYYAFDIAPGFWTWLEKAHRSGLLISIDAVRDELVAHAAGHGDPVVTHEQPSPDSRKRVKIPDACEAMGVEYIDIFSVLRRTGAALHLRGEGDAPSVPTPTAQTIPGLD